MKVKGRISKLEAKAGPAPLSPSEEKKAWQELEDSFYQIKIDIHSTWRTKPLSSDELEKIKPSLREEAHRDMLKARQHYGTITAYREHWKNINLKALIRFMGPIKQEDVVANEPQP
jgi:hypothetical protein